DETRLGARLGLACRRATEIEALIEGSDTNASNHSRVGQEGYDLSSEKRKQATKFYVKACSMQITPQSRYS
ncbi:MAG: hypothetical protein SNJ62_11520, partial [Chloracidobacterium sp.]